MKKVILTACILSVLVSQSAFGLFENKKIISALDQGKIKVGMTKQELIDEIGYPPEGKAKQDNFFFRFTQTKVTAAGKEEHWTYQLGATPGGVRSVTIKMIEGKVQEYNEWLDSQK